MKKFLVILMVLAMASVLFVGCTTPPTPEPEPEPTPTPTVKTDTPYITGITNVSLSSTATQYTNSVGVEGVSVAGALIKVYIDGVQTGVANSGVAGTFGTVTPVAVTMVTLTEGVKKLYITATVPGLAESDKSTEYTFTYDYTKPTMASAIADSSAQTITVTFSENVNMSESSVTTGTFPFSSSALNYARWTLVKTATALVIAEATYTFSKVSDKVVRITCPAGTIDTGTVYAVGVNGVNDKANNTMTVESVLGIVAIQ